MALVEKVTDFLLSERRGVLWIAESARADNRVLHGADL